jgi:hypothetical protein
VSTRSVRGGPANLITVGASIAVFVAALLPWLRTGRASRSAFGLARTADALGLIEGWPLRLLVTSWYLLPLLVAATWTAGALRRPALVATLGAIVGILSITAGLVVALLVRAEVGPVASVGAGTAALAGAIWLARDRGTSRGRRD